MKPPVLVLHATGTNRDHDAAWACELAGAAPDIVHIRALAQTPERLHDYRMLVLPGGFSFGDDLGAGKIWALMLRTQLGDALRSFIDAGRPVLGICNGFQALVKAGFLPGADTAGAQTATLTHNRSGHFECRWVTLEHDPESPCIFTRDLDEPVFCPVAHGEGCFVTTRARLDAIETGKLVALRYTPTPGDANGYPGNPNGSDAHIAGICNARGNVFGLMPHPENHIIAAQHPGYRSGVRGGSGLRLFEHGIRYAAGL
ncbi:MAG: phosphoribosylformylglycinamidine synthase I [Myxococcota bacterium]|jgi:phosphoribosylformylglycinamidine synthase I